LLESAAGLDRQFLLETRRLLQQANRAPS
jgi:hypothetical protein